MSLNRDTANSSSTVNRPADLAHNQAAWDRMANNSHTLTRPVSDEEMRRPLKTIDPAGWLTGGIDGWNVLCLAAGGGRHGPLYTAAGGKVTVVDLSGAMLERDRYVAQQRGLDLRTIQTSMDQLDMLADGEFDLVIHPVSTCYLPNVAKVFTEVARVTRAGGLYISQHKQPINLQASLTTSAGQYSIQHAYYDTTPVPRATEPSKLREPGTREFAHSWASLLGGICQSGFAIEDVTEPMHAKSDAPIGSFHHRCHFIPPYIRLKARRNACVRRSNLVLG
ncbi:MAG TPA: class I SAM-dependent methyltransferase [Planctomycetaceae bacterium]|nr:class I SAM-dependent methyltransferase [Planctomycetaceae bacterium]